MITYRRRSLPLGLWLLGLVCASAGAEVLPYITRGAEYWTECKTCPRVLCPNVVNYGLGDEFNATCWTRGTRIIDGNIWLKSEAGCYVTQYDVTEWDGDYTKDLEYCGRASEIRHITEEDATTKYKTECRICPTLDCGIISYLSEDTDLTLTCWTDQGSKILEDPYHYKTTNNCYVSQQHLYSKPDITYLDNCGPVPHLEREKHFNENGTSDVNKRDPIPEPLPEEMGARYLINVTVGEEYAYCRECPDVNCKSAKRYVFNQSVILQCTQNVNGTWWSESTDFCYVQNADFWEAPEGDFKYFPVCTRFPSDGGGDDEE